MRKHRRSAKTAIANCVYSDALMYLCRLWIYQGRVRHSALRRDAGSQSGQALFEFFCLTLDALHLFALLALAFFPLFFLFAQPLLLFFSLALFLFFRFAALFSLARQFLAGNSIPFLLLTLISFARGSDPLLLRGA